MSLDRFNFVIDALYGCYKLEPVIRALVMQPEIQRLRDVRLSNINSMLLPGSANISRYEHSLGVAYLASVAAESLQMGRRESLALACAALMHDAGITPFGHLMEEAFRWAGFTFDHEGRLKAVFDGDEVGNVEAQIFRGRSAGVRRVLELKEFKDTGLRMEDVFRIKSGLGATGALLNGTIDIDNIDNVCRMAHHIGLPIRPKLGTELVNGFFIDNEELCYDATKVPLIHEWLSLREHLYDVLMTNPFDFVAKAMMIEAMRLALLGSEGYDPVLALDDWKLTDSELTLRLLEYPPTLRLMDALMRGDLHSLYGLFWIEPDTLTARLLQSEGIQDLRQELARNLGLPSQDVLVYVIKDKRVRKIDNLRIRRRESNSAESVASVGDAPRRYLFGACTRVCSNVNASSTKRYEDALDKIFGARSLEPCDPSASIKNVFGAALAAPFSLF